MTLFPDFLPKYTGPYISDGKFQESVLFGTATPKDKLDALSRLHDSAYAKYSDYQHRVAADRIYNKAAKKLVGQFPQLAGSLVLYGNQTSRATSNLARGLTYGPLGFLGGALENMWNLNDTMFNGDSYITEVQDFYATDPYQELQLYPAEPELVKPLGPREGGELPPWQTKVEAERIDNQFVSPLEPMETWNKQDILEYNPPTSSRGTGQIPANRLDGTRGEYSGQGGLRFGFKVKPNKYYGRTRMR